MDYKKERVIGFEEYFVDTNGIVYSKRGKPLKHSINHNGYKIINFYVNHHRKGFAIHTIVAKQFIPNADVAKTQVNHKDGDKENNNVDNLEWVTPLENTKHAINILGYDKTGGNNSNAKPVIAYYPNGLEYKRFPSIIDAAKEFNDKSKKTTSVVNSIWKVVNGIKRTYKGFCWKYA